MTRLMMALMFASFGLALSLSVVIAGVALAAHTAPTDTYFSLNINEDWFVNWDHESPQFGADNVDWPVIFLFYQNASVNRVKRIFWGQCPANPMNLPVVDTPLGWEWDVDRGTKTPCTFPPPLGNALHMRVYGAPGLDYYTNTAWGFYVLATVHTDVDEGRPAGTSGYSEWTEDQIIPIAQQQGLTVWQDWAYFWNPVTPFVQFGIHVVDNDGWGHAVHLPPCPSTPGCPWP